MNCRALITLRGGDVVIVDEHIMVSFGQIWRLFVSVKSNDKLQ